MDEAGEEEGALLVGLLAEFVVLGPKTAQKALAGGLGRVDAGTLALDLPVGLAGFQAFHDEAETAGGGMGGRVAVGEAGGVEACEDEAAKVGGRGVLHPGRDLFGEQFEEEFRHRLQTSLADRCPRARNQPSAAPLASVRTRAM